MPVPPSEPDAGAENSRCSSAWAEAGSQPSSAPAVTAYPSGTRHPAAASCPSRAIFGPTRPLSQARITPSSSTASLSQLTHLCSLAHARTCTVPARPSTRTRSPVLIVVVATAVPTTQGMPYSRLTIAA